jgi:ferredoxin
MVAKMIPKPITRVVPVSESVEARQQVLAFEDVGEMISESDILAVTKCTCRLIAHKCDRPVEVCLQLGKAAEYAIERGTGRKIDKDEAMRLLQVAEEAGLVHVTMNKTSAFHIICNCCDDCCMTFGMLGDRRLNLCDPSRFAARVDAEICEGCGSCVERCYFGALSLEEETEVASVEAEACMGCGLCQVVCPSGALSLVAVREADFVPS